MARPLWKNSCVRPCSNFVPGCLLGHICASHLAAATRDYKFALCHLNDQRQLPPIGSQQRAYLRPAKSTHSHTTTLGRWPGLRPLAQYIPPVSRYLSPTFLAEALACMLNHSRVVFDLILSPFAKKRNVAPISPNPLSPNSTPVKSMPTSTPLFTT